MKDKINLDIFPIFSCLFSLELIFKLIIGLSILSTDIIYIIISSLLISFVLNFVLSFIKKDKPKHIISIIFMFIISIYTFLQACFYNYLKKYVSFKLIFQLSSVSNYFEDFIFHIKLNYLLLFVPLILYIIYIYKYNNKTVFINYFKYILISIVILICYSIMIKDISGLSSIRVKKIGIVMNGILDMNVLNNNTVNKDKLNLYFNRRRLEDNKYTGYFKDKNVIVVYMESVNTIIENKKYFPNFNKMIQNGWYFENNYSPLSSCPTVNNEFSILTSLYVDENTCISKNYSDNKYYNSLFNLFKDKGYSVYSFHDYDESYYKRKKLHKNLGSNYYNIKDMNIKYSKSINEWPSDSEFVPNMFPYFIDKDKFFVFFTTISAHSLYGKSKLGDKYYDLFNDTNYSEKLKRYLSKVKVTDDALGEIINELKKYNKLDNTVIILYGDHYPYLLGNEDLKLISDNNFDIDKYKTPFLIYNSKLKKKTFDYYTSYINVAPTISNLFSLNKETSIYVGDDIFSKNYSNRIIFPDGMWRDDKVIYNSNTGVKSIGNEKYNLKEFKKISTEIEEELKFSDLAIKSNYFKTKE